MSFVQSRRWLLAIVVGVTVLFLAGPGAQGLSAAPPPPAISDPILATFHAGELTLTGQGFGNEPVSGLVRFVDRGGRPTEVTGDSPLVGTWQDGLIELTLPYAVQSGQVTVEVDGVESSPVELRVYLYTSTETPPPGNPMALALASDSTLWFNSEHHLHLKSLSDDMPPVLTTTVEIPQAPGDGIFALCWDRSDPRDDDCLDPEDWHGPRRASGWGEDVAVDAYGRVWFTQGGQGYYPGKAYLEALGYDGYFNTSRVVRYDPATEEFACLNVPADNAQVIGVLIDESRGMVWYSEGELGYSGGSAIAGVTFQDFENLSAHDPDNHHYGCYFDPHNPDHQRDRVCDEGEGPGNGCHWRFPMPEDYQPAHLALDTDNSIWFTAFWGTRIGRLTPETGEIIELPLPPAQAPGFVGSAPWELAFDDEGEHLWVSEAFDATILRVTPGDMSPENNYCQELDSEGQNPCAEEVVVASDGTDGVGMHTVSVGADGLVWFGVNEGFNQDTHPSRIAFVATARDDAVVRLPAMDSLGECFGGIVQDRDSHDVWFAQGFFEPTCINDFEFLGAEIGRLQELGYGENDTDGDGVSDTGDNCAVTPNTDQADSDRDGLGDVCDNPDLDKDGCPDSSELGEDPSLGGHRDPQYFWDFFDTPDSQNRRDSSIRVRDIMAVVRRFGTFDDLGAGPINRNTDPLSAPPETGYHPAYDRGALVGPEPWDAGPPDGRILIGDVIAVVSQYGHSCAQPGS